MAATSPPATGGIEIEVKQPGMNHEEKEILIHLAPNTNALQLHSQVEGISSEEPNLELKTPMMKSVVTLEVKPSITNNAICGIVDPDDKAGKPQVWIRLRPPRSTAATSEKPQDKTFEVEPDGRSLRLLVKPDKRVKSTKRVELKNSHGLIIPTDGILQNSSQDDTCKVIVNKVVDKAMNGVNGAVISLGPESSGKGYTLFGRFSKYKYRGVVPRALERIFRSIEAKCRDVNYVVRLGIVELRRDRIQDLLTLSPCELHHVGEHGPHGMFLQQLGCAEHGLALLIRALTVQKNIPRESYARYHTVVYIDILGEAFLETEPRMIKSRLTFAKLASLPKRSIFGAREVKDAPLDSFISAGDIDCCEYTKSKNLARQVRDPPKKKMTCCKSKSGPMAEAISVRQDLSFLEQLFVRANDFARMRGVPMVTPLKRPKPIHAQYFRQSKLAHCLQDIVSGSTEIRIILHIRPEKQYLQTTLEAIRFAEKAKCVPHNLEIMPEPEDASVERLKEEISDLREELQLQDRISKWLSELSDLYIPLTPEQMRDAQQQATDYYEGKLEHIDIYSKAQVQIILEQLRYLWQKASEDDYHQPKSAQSEKTTEEEAGTVSPKPKSKKNKRKDKADRPISRANNASDPLQHEISSSGENVHQILEQSDDFAIESVLEVEGQEGGSISKDKHGVRKSGQENQIDMSEIPQFFGTGGEQKDVPTKVEAWQAFVKTNQGQAMSEDLIHLENTLKDSTEEHNQVMQKVNSCLHLAVVQSNLQADPSNIQLQQLCRKEKRTSVVSTQEEKDILRDLKLLQYNRDDLLDRLKQLQQRLHLIKRITEGEDRKFNRDELLEQLKNLKMQIHLESRIVEVEKNECDAAFQTFCLDHYGTTFAKDELIIPPIAELVLGDGQENLPIEKIIAQHDEEAAKHFDELKHLARQQAKQYLRFYPKKPNWNPY